MRFFFYGTLLAGSDNPAARLARRKLRLVGPGTANGVLYAVPDPLGWYPALLPGAGTVAGTIHVAGPAFAAEDLALLDAYEDYDLGRPQASLYVRERLDVAAPDGTRSIAEAYVFNQPIPQGARPIAGENFHAWLARHGFRPFGG